MEVAGVAGAAEVAAAARQIDKKNAHPSTYSTDYTFLCGSRHHEVKSVRILLVRRNLLPKQVGSLRKKYSI